MYVLYTNANLLLMKNRLKNDESQLSGEFSIFEVFKLCPFPIRLFLVSQTRTKNKLSQTTDCFKQGLDAYEL